LMYLKMYRADFNLSLLILGLLSVLLLSVSAIGIAKLQNKLKQ